MRPIEILRSTLPTEIFSDAQAMPILGSGARYHGKMNRLIASGAIKRIRRGLYAFGNHLRRQPTNAMSLANTIHSPSYVSLESALANYGLIPEAIKQVTSSTIKRSKRVVTSLGTFLYRVVPGSAFPLGVISTEVQGAHVLLATPEKALLDKLYLDFSGGSLPDYLKHSLRIDEQEWGKFDSDFLYSLSQHYGNRALQKRVFDFVTYLKASS